jgi:hypothetical protein
LLLLFTKILSIEITINFQNKIRSAKMGLIDKTKDLGKKGVDVGIKAGKKGIQVGKKGVGKTKEAMRTKTCSECKHYEPIDEVKGNCPIAGERLCTANVSICPQRAFAPR